jgi:glycosyltransferase involved in cell wall biosynthesis
VRGEKVRIGLDILSEIAGESSGTETYLLGFLRALRGVSEGQHEFFLFVNTGNKAFYQEVVPGFKQVQFPFSSHCKPLRVLSQLSLIPFRARRLNLDVINFLGTTGAFGVGCATVQHVKTLHHIQHPDTVAPGSAFFRRAMMAPSARAADIVIANTQSTREVIVQYFLIDPDRILVVPEAVDHAIFRPASPGDQYLATLMKYKIDRPYLLFVSSLWPYKNVHGLIEAYRVLLENCKINHDLVIVGGITWGDYKERLARLVENYGLGERVRFLGHIRDRSEVRDLYVGSDIYIYPSYAETFGLTLLEAMACGTPVVASNRTSIPEVAGDAAVLVNPDDWEGMAEAMWSVLSDDEKRDSLIAKGLARAREFTWERTARETLQAYQLAVQLHQDSNRSRL